MTTARRIWLWSSWREEVCGPCWTRAIFCRRLKRRAVGADVARALDYAHRRGLVHRDIKPANLIFDDEGRITVADFGLARALAEASWTEPTGAVVGTARYAAPEAVRGKSLDSRADVYALALVLIEASSGSVPFAADTTLATLLGRLERPITAPAATGPLGPILEAAGTINPADRLDALGVARALEGVAAELPSPDPLPLTGAADGEAEVDRNPTDYPGRPRLFDVAQADVEDAPDDVRAKRLLGRRNRSAGRDGRKGAGRNGDGRNGEGWKGEGWKGEGWKGEGWKGEGREPDHRVRRRRWARTAIVAAALAILVAGGGAIVVWATGVLMPSHPVPALIGFTQAAAEQRLAPLHLHLVVSDRAYDPRAPVGTIVGQRPSNGSRLKEGSAVTITLSLGPRPVIIPPVVGLSVSSATALLTYAGLRADVVGHATSMTRPAGVVVSSSPAQGTLPPGQRVALVVSTGKPKVAVPALKGASAASFAAARSALSAVGLTATQRTVYSDTVPAGTAAETVPAAGATVVVGSSVTVVISKGPHLISVPYVGGQSVGAASQILTADGFQVSGVTGNPIATVTATSPYAGAVVQFGSAVQIITG